MKEFIEKYQAAIVRLMIIIGVLLALLLLALICEAVKSYQFIGDGTPATDTITVNGQGTVEKAPDTAKFSFTIQDEESATAAAQTIVSKKVDQVKSDLIAAGIPATDITTANYNSYPDYTSSVITPGGQTTSSTLKGYIVSQDMTVNVKDLTKTEMVAGLLGKDGVTSIDGPNLGFADPNEVTDEARDAAIADAKTQAQTLAASLGVHLVRIVSFSDNSTGIAPQPVMFNKTLAMAVPTVATPPSIPTGVQTVTDTVTITYEIR